ncbi:jasmonate O-methyltransferase [Vigna unguiculata]|uniref:Jasmonate O-methyltransferase n=1 Tax=Vigna unguiculata TaxID=3917 RepID=A0A4D6MTL7_VIGUN|nr:jasmonate O-methyltransferase [Vigna unguiculata]
MADHHTSSSEDEVPKKRTTRGATKLRKLLLRNLKAKLDYFDLPIYGPTLEEVRQVIEEEGSFSLGWDGNLGEDVYDASVDSQTRALIVAKSIRAIFEPLLSIEFGEVIMDEFFFRFAMTVSQLIDTELESLECTNLIMSMSKDS